MGRALYYGGAGLPRGDEEDGAGEGGGASSIAEFRVAGLPRAEIQFATERTISPINIDNAS